jgi:hypothetical protein
VSLLLSCATAARVKVKAHSQFSSSSQGSCRVLARWICQEKTYKENLDQVAECCNSKDVANQELRKACCFYADMAFGDVNNATAATQPVVVEKTPVENIDVDGGETVEDVIEDSLGGRSSNATLDDELVAKLAEVWKKTEMEADLDKTLVQAYYAAAKRRSAEGKQLSWAMSCVDECEDSCESLGGECQPVQSKEDCEAAAEQLAKSFLAYDPNSEHMAKQMRGFPRGCFVKSGKTNTNIVRWNPPTLDAPTIKLNNVCGCYQ